MIQGDIIYSGTIQIDNHNLFEDEIRNLVIEELKKNNIVLETGFQIVYDVLDSEISFSVFYKNYKDRKTCPGDEVVKKISKLKEEFYSCDNDDFARREVLLLEMENILDNYYRSHDIKSNDVIMNPSEDIISVSELKSRLAQNIHRYNDIDVEISIIKNDLSQKLDSDRGVLSEEDIISLESDYLKRISNLNSESVQCLMHIDMIENVLDNINKKEIKNETEKESVDYSVLDNIQMIVYPKSVHEGDSKKMPLMIKQLIELRLKSKVHPQLIPNTSNLHERKSTDEKVPDMLVNFTISFDPIDDSSKEIIYVLEDNEDYYVSLDVLKRFNISSSIELIYNDRLYYRISNSDFLKISSNKDNDYSPYEIIIESLSLNNNIFDDPISEVIIPEAVEKKNLDLYQSDESDDFYILKSVCESSNIPFTNVVVVDDLEYVLINSENIDEFRNRFSDYEFIYHTIDVPSHIEDALNNVDSTNEIVSRDDVIRKLYDNLTTPLTNPNPCDVKVTRTFINDLQAAGDGFNIICSLGDIDRSGSKDLYAFLTNNLMSTPRGQEVYERFMERVNSLSDDELAVLTAGDYESTGVFGLKK